MCHPTLVFVLPLVLGSSEYHFMVKLKCQSKLPTACLGTADIWVHVVHTSCVVIVYTLESLYSLTDNTQLTLRKKDIKKETQKSEGTH